MIREGQPLLLGHAPAGVQAQCQRREPLACKPLGAEIRDSYIATTDLRTVVDLVGGIALQYFPPHVRPCRAQLRTGEQFGQLAARETSIACELDAVITNLRHFAHRCGKVARRLVAYRVHLQRY